MSFTNIGRWEYFGSLRVTCIGAKGNQFQELAHTGSPGFLGAIKLIHQKGQIACNDNKSGLSNWGCIGGIYDLRMVITDSRNSRIYPAPRLVNFTRYSGYNLPTYSATSKELVLSDLGNPLFLNTGEKLRVWYSEDLFNNYEHDNQGSTCMTVQAYFL